MILGIDTSNYTTSAAVLDGEALTQQKQLLEVRPGERGLRQSDALFQHTRNDRHSFLITSRQWMG